MSAWTFEVDNAEPWAYWDNFFTNLKEKFQAIAHKFPQSGRTLVKSNGVKK